MFQEERRFDFSSLDQGPLAGDCCACFNLADPVPSNKNAARLDARLNKAYRKGRIAADGAFFYLARQFRPPGLMLRASLLAGVPATVVSEERP